MLDDLLERQILAFEGGVYRWGMQAEAIAAYAEACRWPDELSHGAAMIPAGELSTVS
ncbi:hypothetical protein D3C87_2102070 [compost metagenome]